MQDLVGYNASAYQGIFKNGTHEGKKALYHGNSTLIVSPCYVSLSFCLTKTSAYSIAYHSTMQLSAFILVIPHIHINFVLHEFVYFTQIYLLLLMHFPPFGDTQL